MHPAEAMGKFKREERRKYWEHKTKTAAASGDEHAKQLVERSKARETAFDKLQNKCVEGSLRPAVQVDHVRQEVPIWTSMQVAHTLTSVRSATLSQCRHKHKQICPPWRRCWEDTIARKQMADHL